MAEKYRAVKKARVIDGFVKVGDWVRHLGPTLSSRCRPSVRIVAIHAQGFDGTILTTEPGPDPQFPHHYGCRASECEKALPR